MVLGRLDVVARGMISASQYKFDLCKFGYALFSLNRPELFVKNCGKVKTQPK